MKKLILSALIALSTLSSSQAANLYSSNLGNGVSLSDATVGIPEGTIRFGVFPNGFDFDANVDNFAALDAAFIEVASFSGDLTVDSVDGFYQSALSYDTSATYDDTVYATGIAGQKVYIWVLNSLVPEEVTQQLIVSSNQTWVAADAVIADTFASPDTGVAGLTFHVGSNALGNNIGAGANSHVLGGAQTEITEAVLSAAPSATANAGTNVILTVTSDGSGPKSFIWSKDGEVIPEESSSTLDLGTTVAQDTGVYSVLVSNNVTEEFETNELSVTINTPKPTFLTQPVGTVVAEGDELNLTSKAVAQGTLLYQWKKGANIVGQTSPELSLPNMSLKQAGSYSVTVTNLPTAGGGAVNSAKAEVVVVSQATNTLVSPVGAKVTLTALIAGKGASFQWFKVGTVEPLTNGADYTGVTTTKLSVLAVDGADSGDYYCTVSVGEVDVNSGLQTLNVYTAAPALDETLTGLPAMPDGKIGETYSYQIPVLGGASGAPATYGQKGLPAGLTLNTKTGLITGRPSKATTGDVTVTFTVTNKLGSDTATASIAILASPELSGLAGLYVGPIDRNTESGIFGAELGGRFEMTVTTLGSITGKLFLGATQLSVKGFIELGGELPSTELVVARPGNLTPLKIGIEIDGDEIFGFISDTVVGSDMVFDGYRNVYKKGTNEPEGLGQYNFVIALDDENEDLVTDATLPQGAGYGIFTVAADGKLSVKGKTADGEAFTTASFLSPDYDVFIFQTLYKTVQKGSILGRLAIDEDQLIDGSATQLRPADPSTKQRTYAAGFDLTDEEENALIIRGGAYTAPASKIYLDASANDVAQLIFIRGVEEAAEAAEAGITLLDNFKFTIGANEAKTKLVINSKTGLITGSFALADKRASKFEGVIIPDEADFIGAGFYTLPSAVGTTSSILSGLMVLEVPVP